MVGGIHRFVKYIQEGTFNAKGNGTSRAEISFFGRLPSVEEVEATFINHSEAISLCMKHCYDVPLDSYWVSFWKLVKEPIIVLTP
jgi:hypothetical protein